MRSAILYGAHDFRIDELPTPEIREDECLVKVKACGVCHSELHQWDKRIKDLDYPRHIGHEVSGEVLKVGKNVKDFKPGDRVAVWADGKGYAEELAAKAERLCLIAPEIPYELALSEPIMCTTNGVMKANVQLNDTVALVGTGFMGLILMQEIKLRGVKQLIAIDVRQEMLDLAGKLGADVVINPLKEDPVKAVRKLTGDKGVDIGFEVGGVQATFELAPELIRMEGKLVIFGYHPGPRQIKDLGYWNWMAFDIINAHFRDMNTILRGARIGMALLNDGKINMEPLITHRYKLEEIETAFSAAKEKPKGFVKSVIMME
ncbi:MAG: zinc-binding dehydrogenase [Ignavibacteria bacterium]|nr:zinc-binding dehydrogenase [Ignavibacteria bacterium]MCU7504987.1 zinc-binding dehydrogenase [Ignavibacteria bacterium]MCU7514879.1 zinc-binding dehydrogenase [Ignavibacteria bacterium]